MAISLALTVFGAIIVFATRTAAHIGGLPWLNVHAAGWVMLITGALTFIVGAFAARDSRWFGRWFGRGD